MNGIIFIISCLVQRAVATLSGRFTRTWASSTLRRNFPKGRCGGLDWGAGAGFCRFDHGVSAAGSMLLGGRDDKRRMG